MERPALACYDRQSGVPGVTGMRWDKSYAEAMMAPASLYHSGQWGTYWKSERAAA
jgi:hypothetical protein